MYLLNRNGTMVVYLNELWVLPVEGTEGAVLCHRAVGQYGGCGYTVVAEYPTVEEAEVQVRGVALALARSATYYALD